MLLLKRGFLSEQMAQLLDRSLCGFENAYLQTLKPTSGGVDARPLTKPPIRLLGSLEMDGVECLHAMTLLKAFMNTLHTYLPLNMSVLMHGSVFSN